MSAAGEYSPLNDPRACLFKSRLRDKVRDDYMLVEIHPRVIDQARGLNDEIVLLSTRWKDQNIFAIKSWPISVYVSRVMDRGLLNASFFSSGQVELIAWGLIFKTRGEADAHARKMC